MKSNIKIFAPFVLAILIGSLTFAFAQTNKTNFDGGKNNNPIGHWMPPQNGLLYWYIFNSSTSAFTGAQFGLSTDLAVPGDYDGDGKTDIAVWRETDGTFYILNSADNSVSSRQWGFTSDVPLAAYDSH